MNYWIIFLTGLTTGGLTCLAVQGGLLASALVEDGGSTNRPSKIRTIIIFLSTKLVAYSLLGLLLGLLGSAISLSLKTGAYLNIAISLFMLAIAMETLKIHPIFRYFIIQPPKFIRKSLRNASKNKGDFAAFILGLATILIPCGTTQAMMALAISSADAFNGFFTLFSFILGTVPLFLILGILATKLNENYRKIFTKVIAISLIIIALYNTNNALNILGVKTFQPKPKNINTSVSSKVENKANIKIQKAQIKINDSYGYDPSYIKLKINIPAEITLINDGARGCIRAFIVPDLNMQQYLSSDTEVIKFTPTKRGTINFSCSMGMYNGAFIVE